MKNTNYNYKPTKEDIKRICNEAYEEDKELIDAIIKGLGKK